MNTKIIFAIVILITIVSTAAQLLSNKRQVEAHIYKPDANRKILVEADTVFSHPFAHTYLYTGTCMPNRETSLIPQTAGEVRGVYFEEGDQVAQGKLLLQIDDELLQAQRLSVEATLENARINLHRYEQAAQSGGASAMQVDSWLLTMKSAEAQLRQLNKQISLCRVTAPFSGTITMRDIERGSIAGAAPVGQITDLSQLKLEISVPEKEIAYFHKGDNLPLSVDATAESGIMGQVEYVSPRADDFHNYLVRLTIKNAPGLALKAGMYATVSMQHKEETETLAIPRTALQGSAKDPLVFVVRDGHAALISISTGQGNADLIEVTSGLSDGDVLITTGHINLEDGSPVELIHR